MADKLEVNGSKMVARDIPESLSSRVYKYAVYAASFIISFIIFLKTMNPTSFGYDTTWFHIQVAELAVGQTTGFPLAFLLGKLFTFLPFGTLAFRLNMFSVFWGAATVTVFVMIISNLLKKEYYIALVSALFFAFFRFFWAGTNRFEVYTLHTFLIGLIILFGIYWLQTKKNRYLYLYYLFIGLSLTNHPLSLFLLPVLVLFPVFTDWREVFKIKRVFIIIALIAAPLLLYLYIPIRSFQGHGNIKTLEQFIYYITGSQWKNNLGFKSLLILKKQIYGYLHPILADLKIPALIILIVGEIMLFLKNRKYFLLMLALLVSYFIPLFLYERTVSDFYIIFIITLIIVPFAFGLYYIKAAIIHVFHKIGVRISVKNNLAASKDETSPKKVILKPEKTNGADKDNGAPAKKTSSELPVQNNRHRKFIIVFLICFFAIISILPIQLCASNYPVVDKSRDTMIYDYWKTIITEMKDNSVLITNSKSSNVALYLTKFEFNKNIEIKISFDSEIMNYTRENFGKKPIYVNQVNFSPLDPVFKLKPIGYELLWKDYNELLQTYEILGFKKNVDFALSDKVIDMKFGEEKVIYYIIKNKSENNLLNIDSIELKLPKSLKLLAMDATQSDIKDMPGKAKGVFMWTKGPYVLEPGGELKLAITIKGVAPGSNKIEFRFTTLKMYENGPDIAVTVK